MKNEQTISSPRLSLSNSVKSKKKKMDARSRTFYLMVIPAAVLFFAFHIYPALKGVYYSFTNWNGITLDYDFVGFKNYFNLFKDETIKASYLFTFKFAIFA